MGITLSICRLSKKREAMLREDPTLCWELTHEVPGFLAIGKAWDALRVAAQKAGADPLVVQLLAGELGKSFGEAAGFGKPRIVNAFDVAAAAKAFQKVEAGFILDNLDALRGVEVHGGYFHDDLGAAPIEGGLLADLPTLASMSGEDEGSPHLQALEDTFAKVRTLLVEAAGRGDSLLVMFR